MAVPELFVAFACDTEDNHPNYVPGWTKYGSNYESKPAFLNWSWTHYWSDLSECFLKKDVPITWLIRVDSGPVYDTMLTLCKNKILELKSMGDEIGIHIHTWLWNGGLSKWVQTTNPVDEVRIVLESLDMFKSHLGFIPLSARMGWTAMSNDIMRTLNSNGIIAEASATPGIKSAGKFGNRDNIFDWFRAPKTPYHPHFNDYQSPGNMNILEIPVSSLETKRSSIFGKVINKLSGKKSLFKLIHLAKCLHLTPHSSFYITPWWSNSLYKNIIEEYGKKVNEEGPSCLIGTFHSCDILDPKTGDINHVFAKLLSNILEEISSLDVDVKFVTLSEMARRLI